MASDSPAARSTAKDAATAADAGAAWPGPGVAVVIPAYRPLSHLVDGVRALSRAGCRTIVIVDDGSGPDHAEIFAGTRAFGGVVVLGHGDNRGKGAALKTAFRHIIGHCPDIGGVVTMDADGQHLTDDVVAVANAFADDPDALVLGARRMGAGVPWRSRLGNGLTRVLFRLVAGRDIRDTQTGLRAIPVAFLGDLLAVPANRYDFELEMLLKARPAGIDIVETGIETVYLDGNASSHFNPVVDSLLIYFSLLRFTLSALAATVADFIGFTLALGSGLGVPVALAVGRVFGVAVNFSLNRGFVFHYQRRLAFTLFKYLTLVVVLAVVSYGLIVLFTATFGIHVLLAKIIAEGLLFAFSYLIQRTLVFAGPDD